MLRPPPQIIVRHMAPEILTPGHALKLRAKQDLEDSNGVTRSTGEEWLVRDIGAYLPGVFEEVCDFLSVCLSVCHTFEEVCVCVKNF